MKEKNLILIDTSYTSFYRFFATTRWYAMANPEEYKKNIKDNNEYDWLNNNIFIEKYDKMYLESIIKLVGKKIFNNSDIIFCMDSPRNNLWRSKLHSTYKSDRIDLSKKNNFKPVFKHTYRTLIPNIIKNNNNITNLLIDELEADDIIACITMHLEEKKNKKIYIISGDQDFLQLGRENVFFIDYKKKELINLTKEQALQSLTKKLLLGDISDCIPGIFKKGKKDNKINKNKLIESNDLLNEYLENNKEAKEQYQLNNDIINFKKIPKKFYNDIINKFNLL